MAIPLHRPKLNLDEAVRNSVTESVIEILQGTFSISAELIDFRKIVNYSVAGDISGTVGMIQEKHEGNMVVSFSRASLGQILRRVYGLSLDEGGELMRDGAAELTNMIYGKIKFRLAAIGYEFAMTLPSVIMGSNHNINQGSKSQSGLFIFQFDQTFLFHVVVTLTQDR